jgi:hypothetical protein
MSDSRGRYAIDNVPPGVRVVTVDHDVYEALGVRAGEAKVLLDEGAVRDVSFNGPDTEDVTRMLCGGDVERGRVTLRLTVLDSATARPIQGLRVSLAERDGSADGDPHAEDLEVDANGVVTFCNAPANRPLSLTARIGKVSARVELKLPRGLTNQVVRWPGTGTIRL